MRGTFFELFHRQLNFSCRTTANKQIGILGGKTSGYDGYASSPERICT
jgi:hypothetical protein